MIRVAILDSGLSVDHPHLSGLRAEGFALHGDAPPLQRGSDWSDCTGHGTACTAALFRLVQDIDVLAIRLLDEELRTTTAALAAGIVEAAREGARVINLSLGSRADEARAPLEAAVREAAELGAVCVAAAHPRGRSLWPADLPTVLSATTHRSCPLRDLYRVRGEQPRYVAHGWPRPIEGAPPTDNLFGPSVAAVHLTARVVMQLQAQPDLGLPELIEALDDLCCGDWEPI